MASSSNYFFKDSDDDEENPFINRENNDRNIRNKKIINDDNNNINNNNENGRYIRNDVSILNSSLAQENYYQNPNKRKRIKVNEQNEILINEKENRTDTKYRTLNNYRNEYRKDANVNGNATSLNNNNSYTNAHRQQQASQNYSTIPIIIEDVTNNNVEETETDKEIRNISVREKQKQKEKKKEIIDETEENSNSTNPTKKVINNSLNSSESSEGETSNPKFQEPTQSIRSKKLEIALDSTISKINRLVSYKRFRQCFPTLCSNNREDMKDVHSQMALYFTDALKDEFQIIFKKFEMDKNLLLIDECCRQGKKVNPNDTPNKPVNVIYNRVGPDTIIRSNSVNIKKKQLEDLKTYYNELCEDKSLDEWIALDKEKKKYKESIEDYITYLSKNIEIMKKNDDY
ncbi:hypothetical protein H8356DRAFT_1047915 [Neocallimastix lanati (nom. inval.)]|uniref:Uncharacterized protein n=1 Tax=Neocallimastix californiae TaxID=1754190 RepID=A0A1Y2C128_9FUNG|nr:hypothetical protein H8356DRAFT_1047915 [Neocallimastix sp. JGI-2020a]ORY40015.1 hypothetical protein LY90DRAFT_672246 [Neocallimastix californiae]|eukprot:ORY40015.1 hypothetical protein LY90DRAFT_672246 [Neocallimastix californiae]